MQFNKTRIKAILIGIAIVISGFAVLFNGTGHPMVGTNTIYSTSVGQNVKIGQYSDGNNAQGGVYDPFNQELYVTNYQSNNVTVVNGFLNISVANISVGSEPFGIAYVPYNHDLYVNNYQTKNISIISSVSNKVVSTISLTGSPRFSVYDPQNEKLYVSGLEFSTGVIWVINVTNNSVVSTPSLPPSSTPYGMVFDPFNGDIYVADYNNNDVFVLSSSGVIVAEIVGYV